ncbi:hypothetical protein CXG81DRAFT_12232 [Caulochytrium protostelioides]|uniref:U-box domain-containing protein n=1 Tax=Caulochytrium protostelioides TaxID=1555241 RepID=A0A4P9X7P4_9FUNG|nr:hypothetical protein CXG81DRAFT_12232 [Caulochytrium protostelioides]|eukprot:RKP01255.1 hypothetical protein CXG81DRAFT_12232 [Caulochytrium protostelioides]
MGASLSTRFAEAAPPETSAVQKALLQDLIAAVQSIATEHLSAARAEFVKPLQWPTTLRPTHFAAGTEWKTDTNRNPKLPVVSQALRTDGSPLLALEQIVAGEKYHLRVSSFEYLHHALQLADTAKMGEIQALCRVNTTPLDTIFGHSGTNALADLFDRFNHEADPVQKEMAGRLYRLLLLINSFDIQMLATNVDKAQNAQHLTVDAVRDELVLLQEFAGAAAQQPLAAIDWSNSAAFKNGYHAPPWRQIQGELGYITVATREGERLVVTAHRSGYFVNKGFYTDEQGSTQLNYEPAGTTTYPTLVALMKAQSPHFARTIDAQPYGWNAQYHNASFDVAPSGAAYAASAAAGKHSDPSDLSDAAGLASGIGAGGRGKNTVNANDDASNANGGKAALSGRRKLGGAAKKEGGMAASAAAAGIGAAKDKDGLSLKWRALESNPYDSEDEDSTPEEEGSDKRHEAAYLPAEYYQIQKLVKYMRCGNPTATIIAICSLRDFDLNHEPCQLAIRDVGGLDTLVNLLDTENIKCKLSSLKVLRDVTQNMSIRAAMAQLGGMQALVGLLDDDGAETEVHCLAAETIAHCARNKVNRRAIRLYGGIDKLVKLLKAHGAANDESVAVSVVQALVSCCKSAKNKRAILAAGAMPLLAQLLASSNERLLIPVVAILQECAVDESYRTLIRSSGMLQFLVTNLSTKNMELQTNCASAIFRCAEDAEARSLVRSYGVLTPLVSLLETTAHKDLLAAVTGAIWKCALDPQNAVAFSKCTRKLVMLLDNQPEDVLINVVGALGAAAQTPEGRQAIREANGITSLVGLLKGTNQALLVNVTTAVGACAHDPECMAVIDRLDGVRLLWSLLKSPSSAVQASAAWAISPCIENAKEAGEMVRSFVGGLELIVSLLKSDDPEVLASVCAAIANIAKDEENLAVITDHAVVPMLAKLTTTRSDRLRRHLAEAIARCCRWGNNSVAFGAAGAVAPLVKYLRSRDEAVHQSTARALHQLSADPDNCITMHENGVVQLLLGMVGSSDPALQEASAGTIGNIRRLALASEKSSLH